MEVPRHKRLQRWRYSLTVDTCAQCGKVQNEVPTGIRDFVEGGGVKELRAQAVLFEGLAASAESKLQVE